MFNSADSDVKFKRKSATYGSDGLDYIIAISNRSLQSLARYLVICTE
jgi:hypothetical protein